MAHRLCPRLPEGQAPVLRGQCKLPSCRRFLLPALRLPFFFLVHLPCLLRFPCLYIDPCRMLRFLHLRDICCRLLRLFLRLFLFLHLRGDPCRLRGLFLRLSRLLHMRDICCCLLRFFPRLSTSRQRHSSQHRQNTRRLSHTISFSAHDTTLLFLL